MSRVLQEQWKTISAGSIERRAELELLYAAVIASDDRIVVLEGGPGTGKTTLAAQFVRAYREAFPGGIEYSTGTGEPDRQLTPASANERALLVFDGLDEVWIGVEKTLGYLESRKAENPFLHVLLTSRALPQLAPFERIALGPMTNAEIETLIAREAGNAGLPPASIVAVTGGNPLLARMIAQIMQKRGDWPSLIESLRSFRRPGLIDIHGQPLSGQSQPARTFISDVRDVNEAIMQMARLDPDIVYQLPPRRFEEISAELFTRLGYEVTLTPASNEGGKDLIIVKRTDLGTMLTFVECKRHLPGTPVGVEIVRTLNGVVEEGRATSGIVLTSSRFTRGARIEQRKLEYRMSLKDYSDFKELLDRAMQPLIR